MTKCYRVVCDSENHDPSSGVTMHHDLADSSKDYVNQWGTSSSLLYRTHCLTPWILGLSRSAIFSAVEASLRRLNTHYIDVLQIHRFDTTVSPKEVMGALHDLVRSGMVRYIGASSMWAYQFAMMQNVAEQNGWTTFISMQNHYNLLYREEEREMNKYCEATGVGLIPVSIDPCTWWCGETSINTTVTVGTIGPWQTCETAKPTTEHAAWELEQQWLAIRR